MLKLINKEREAENGLNISNFSDLTTHQDRGFLAKIMSKHWGYGSPKFCAISGYTIDYLENENKFGPINDPMRWRRYSDHIFHDKQEFVKTLVPDK